MTGMVGTALYVSPEVQGNTKATYNQVRFQFVLEYKCDLVSECLVLIHSFCLQKVDLFSLGIILFEMSYRPMTTGAERISVLSQLRVVGPCSRLGAIYVEALKLLFILSLFMLQEPISFPEDFAAYEQGTQVRTLLHNFWYRVFLCVSQSISKTSFCLSSCQRKVTEWLLKHDPALRPTAQELLKSELLPPPQMEESELHEVLQHTMANINGKAYRTMVGQLFAQNTTPVMDYTYDIDLHKV